MLSSPVQVVNDKADHHPDDSYPAAVGLAAYVDQGIDMVMSQQGDKIIQWVIAVADGVNLTGIFWQGRHNSCPQVGMGGFCFQGGL